MVSDRGEWYLTQGNLTSIILIVKLSKYKKSGCLPGLTLLTSINLTFIYSIQALIKYNVKMSLIISLISKAIQNIPKTKKIAA
jgi:hypothetical protein